MITESMSVKARWLTIDVQKEMGSDVVLVKVRSADGTKCLEGEMTHTDGYLVVGLHMAISEILFQLTKAGAFGLSVSAREFTVHELEQVQDSLECPIDY